MLSAFRTFLVIYSSFPFSQVRLGCCSSCEITMVFNYTFVFSFNCSIPVCLSVLIMLSIDNSHSTHMLLCRANVQASLWFGTSGAWKRCICDCQHESIDNKHLTYLLQCPASLQASIWDKFCVERIYFCLQASMQSPWVIQWNACFGNVHRKIGFVINLYKMKKKFLYMERT